MRCRVYRILTGDNLPLLTQANFVSYRSNPKSNDLTYLYIKMRAVIMIMKISTVKIIIL
jgi:hypothetical protein